MEMRVATWDPVRSVLDRLSDQHRAEYAKIGFPSAAFDMRLIGFMLRGETHCLWFDGQPQAFIAVAPTNGVVTTWLGLTKTCFDAGIGPIRIGRKHMRAMAHKYGPITSFVASGHPKVRKWMEVLGFEQIEETPEVKVFRFA